MTPKHIAQAKVSKNLSNNSGNRPPIVVSDVVRIWRVDLTVVSINVSFETWPVPASSLRWDRTTMESLIANPARPTIPTKPIKPKFWNPTNIPKKPRPIQRVPTSKIILAWRKLFNIMTKVITIKPKNKKKVLNSCPNDSALSSASPNWAML